MACCAMPGGCENPACRLCRSNTKLDLMDDRQKRDRAELKDSKPLPDLSAPRAAAVALGKIRRPRKGPHR